MAPDSMRKRNKPGGEKFGLPPDVVGNHEHCWNEANKHDTMKHGYSSLPYRTDVSPRVKRFDQALQHFLKSVNVKILPHQRDFDLPHKES